ncbi:MAG TPA: hypothetical protein VMK12_25705 [Anaeromyxobacteraceae bacterium]|nr:hypothetical protein [Anaeromyxobacteraceae bacterium]
MGQVAMTIIVAQMIAAANGSMIQRLLFVTNPSWLTMKVFTPVTR